MINGMYGFAQGGGLFSKILVQSLMGGDKSGVNETADKWNIWTCTGGWGIFENSSVESDSRDQSGVNEIADQQIVWNHSTSGDFSK